VQLLLGGIALGSIYALVAIGIVLIYKATDVTNFAQGEILMVGAYAYVLIAEVTDAPVLQLLGTLLAGALTGLVFFGVTHFVLARAAHIQVVIGTFALLILLQAGARQLFTDNPRRAPAWLFGQRTVEVFGAVIPMNAVVTLVAIAVVGAALFVWFRWTPYGKAMSAVAENHHGAALTGLPVRVLLAGSWMMGGALAALAGMLLSPTTGVFPGIGASVLFAGFIGALLGGFTSIAGALVGGLLLGLLHTYGVVTIGGALRDVVTFSVLVLILLVRPTGLFGATRLREF
jgi:branched-chain amino acid transport system permease protein